MKKIINFLNKVDYEPLLWVISVGFALCLHAYAISEDSVYLKAVVAFWYLALTMIWIFRAIERGSYSNNIDLDIFDNLVDNRDHGKLYEITATSDMKRDLLVLRHNMNLRKGYTVKLAQVKEILDAYYVKRGYRKIGVGVSSGEVSEA